MGQYIGKRLLISVPILIAVTAIIFTLLQLTPGDPLDAYLSPDQVLRRISARSCVISLVSTSLLPCATSTGYGKYLAAISATA